MSYVEATDNSHAPHINLGRKRHRRGVNDELNRIQPKRDIKAVNYQWRIKICEQDKVLGYPKVGTHLNKQLEISFRNKKKELSYGGTTYDLEKMVVISDNPTVTVYLERLLRITEKLVQLPVYWNPTQTHTCQLFDVEKGSGEFDKIQNEMKKTLPDVQIVGIQRIQNLLVYHRYYSAMRGVSISCNDTDEKLFFHGTRNIPPGIIISCQEGFDSRLAGNQNLWGPGVYFAQDASYADAFAFQGLGTKQIIVASVTLGDCFDYGLLCNPSLRKPPKNIRTGKEYNSVSGITKGKRVYSVFNSAQCCPRYIVRYKNAPTVASETPSSCQPTHSPQPQQIESTAPETNENSLTPRTDKGSKLVTHLSSMNHI